MTDPSVIHEKIVALLFYNDRVCWSHHSLAEHINAFLFTFTKTKHVKTVLQLLTHIIRNGIICLFLYTTRPNEPNKTVHRGGERSLQSGTILSLKALYHDPFMYANNWIQSRDTHQTYKATIPGSQENTETFVWVGRLTLQNTTCWFLRTFSRDKNSEIIEFCK